MMDYDKLYAILRGIAITQGSPIRYGDLSNQYAQATGDYIDPHMGWSEPLLEVLKWCRKNKLPPLSALVVNEDGMPGSGFWGQEGLPPKPSLTDWVTMCRNIYVANWPATMN